jgi:hypothetical protein
MDLRLRCSMVDPRCRGGGGVDPVERLVVAQVQVAAVSQIASMKYVNRRLVGLRGPKCGCVWSGWFLGGTYN